MIVISEFGRTMHENGNGGTDHGHGNVMWVMGGPVGGKVYGKWPAVARAVPGARPRGDHRFPRSDRDGPRIAHGVHGFTDRSSIPGRPRPSGNVDGLIKA